MRRSAGVSGPSAAAEREHALRNAWNVLELSLSIARDALEEGDAARAADFIARAQQASQQCRHLLDASAAPGRGQRRPA